MDARRPEQTLPTSGHHRSGRALDHAAVPWLCSWCVASAMARPPVYGLSLLRFPAFLVGDPPPGAFQVAQLHALQEAKQHETGRTWIVQRSIL